MASQMPGVRPAVPHFSSGPCAKRPGWSLQALTDAALGRSHRAKLGKGKLKRAIDLTREVLQVPADYRIGIVPVSDVTKELKLKDVTVLKAPYGQLPDLAKVDWSTDVVFTWNGTTSGVRVPG